MIFDSIYEHSLRLIISNQYIFWSFAVSSLWLDLMTTTWWQEREIVANFQILKMNFFRIVVLIVAIFTIIVVIAIFSTIIEVAIAHETTFVKKISRLRVYISRLSYRFETLNLAATKDLFLWNISKSTSMSLLSNSSLHHRRFKMQRHHSHRLLTSWWCSREWASRNSQNFSFCKSSHSFSS